MTLNCSPSYFRMTTICKHPSPGRSRQRHLHNDGLCWNRETTGRRISCPKRGRLHSSSIPVGWCHQATAQSLLLEGQTPETIPTYNTSVPPVRSTQLLWTADRAPLSEQLSHSPIPSWCGLSFQSIISWDTCLWTISNNPVRVWGSHGASWGLSNLLLSDISMVRCTRGSTTSLPVSATLQAF